MPYGNCVNASLYPIRLQLYEDKIEELNGQLDVVQADYSGRVDQLNGAITKQQV